MSNLSFKITPSAIEKLFAQGHCLSHCYYYTPQIETYKNSLRKKFGYNCLFVHNRPNFCCVGYAFHYFDNGTLLMLAGFEEVLAQYQALLQQYQLPIKQILTIGSTDEMRMINEYAMAHYDYRSELIARPFPALKEFITNVFADNNICLNVSKQASFDPKHRRYLAWFNNGFEYISQDYNQPLGKNNLQQIFNFDTQELKHYLLRERIYVPQAYIDAIYQQAPNYDWYSADFSYQQMKEPMINSFEQAKMEKFISSIIDNNPCLSVNGISQRLNPDKRKYALLADGTLLIAQNALSKQSLKSELGQLFPKLSIQMQLVPAFYINAVYQALLHKQKTACSIYLEIMKQKARHLKKKLHLKHHEALDLAAQISGWKNWHDVLKIDDEAQARYCICNEKRKKELYSKQHQDTILQEYYIYKSQI